MSSFCEVLESEEVKESDETEPLFGFGLWSPPDVEEVDELVTEVDVAGSEVLVVEGAAGLVVLTPLSVRTVSLT